MRDRDYFTELWKSLPKELQDELAKTVKGSSHRSPEEFAWHIFVGNCPRCGNKATKSCEDVPGIKNVTLGLCTKCGFLWCTECGRPAVKGRTCEHWEICERCPEKKDRSGDCGVPAWECESASVYGETEDDEMTLTCAWCNKDIEEDTEVFGLGAKARTRMDLGARAGSTIEIPLTYAKRTIPAIVPARKSEAKKAGNDIMFMICSKKCGELLKKALLKERFKIVSKD
jgi:hypothetical protein